MKEDEEDLPKVESKPAPKINWFNLHDSLEADTAIESRVLTQQTRQSLQRHLGL